MEKGAQTTWVTTVGSRVTSLCVRKTRITAQTGAEKGKVWQKESQRIRVGGQSWNDVVLSDPKVSGLHCELSLTEQGYLVRDHDSTNGTYVNDVRVLEAYLQDGATLRLGDTELVINGEQDSVEHSLSEDDHFGPLLGGSVVMRKLFADLARVSPSDVTVLIQGETGVGKELVAAAIHDSSNRADDPFVVLDCGAIAPNLVESELFGHERGAFTGATGKYAGAFERAHKGTLFLDEIGELPLAMQPKLLRALETRTVRRLGASTPLETDVRIIAATNRDLASEVNQGRFRSDLYFRLAVVEVEVPPLRERPDDIPLLARSFLEHLPSADNSTLDPALLEQLRGYHWPGNVRELRNIVERAVLMGHVPQHRTRAVTSDPNVSVDLEVPFKLAKKKLVEAFELAYVKELMAKHDGNVSAAARAAGLDRMSLHKILQRHDLR